MSLQQLVGKEAYLHVLEQKTASLAGFLFRKTVFKQAYPTLCYNDVLVREGEVVPSLPLYVVSFLGTSGIM